MNQIVCLVPARGGSRGIPKKNLTLCAGKPLLLWTLEQALAADIGPVIVATDDSEIAKVADGYGVTVYEEPTEVAGDAVSMETVMRWFLRQCAERRGHGAESKGPDWLFLLQCTSPLRLSHHVRECAAIAKTNAFDSIFSVVKSAHCSWRKRGTDIMPEWPQGEGLKRLLRQEVDSQFTENGAIYAVRVRKFQETRFCGNLCPYEMPDWSRFEVDTPEDLAIVEVIMRTRLQLGADGVRT